MYKKKLRILIGLMALGVAIVFFAIFLGRSFNEEVYSVSQVRRGEVLKLTPSVPSAYSKFNLRMQFTYDGNGKFPNLFQTDDSNTGLRFELDGHKAGFIISDSFKAEGYRILPLAAPIEFGRWYALEIRVANHEYFEAYLDGAKVVDFKAKNIVIANTNFLVGQGFNSERVFSGEIRNVENVFYIPNKIWRIYKKIELNFPFPFLANYIFLFGFLVFLKIKGLNEINLRKISNYKALVPILVLMHAYIALKVPEYKVTCIVYLFLFLAGVSHYSFLFPASWRGKSFDYLFIPINGLIFVAIMGGIFIAASLKVTFLPWVIISIELLALAMLFVYKKNIVVQQFQLLRYNLKDCFLFYSLLVVPVTLIVLYPVLFNDFQTSPVRIGPDLVSYANMSQYLLDGGTWDLSRSRAFEFKGMKPSDIVAYSDATMSWPFMFYFRWGLSAFQSVVSLITFSSHAYETSFVSILLPYLFLGGVVLFYLREKLGMGLFISSLGFIALIFNANLINLWFEGFHANVFSLLFLTLAIVIILEIKAPKISKHNLQNGLLLLILLFVVLLFSYPEVIFFVLLPLLAVKMLVELLIFRRCDLKPYLISIGCILLAILFVLPFGFLIDWLTLTYSQIVNSGGNGYCQPLWALPNEILGFNNLYLSSHNVDAGHLLVRSPLKLIYCGFISLCILISISTFLKEGAERPKDLLLAIILLIASSFYFAYGKVPENNYSYMKVYATLLPIMLFLFWSSLNDLFNRYLLKYQIDRNMFFLCLTLPIFFNGLSFVNDYSKETDFIDSGMIALHEEARQINLQHVVIYPVQLTKNRTFYSAIIPTHWFFPSIWQSSVVSKKLFDNFADYKVYLFYEKSSDQAYSDLRYKVILQNKSFLILDSGMTLQHLKEIDTKLIKK